MLEVNGIKMYDTEETAKLFNVSEWTIRNMRRRGAIRSVRLGNKKYTSEGTIREFLDGLIVPQPKKVNK